MILTLSPAVKARSWDADYLWSHWAAFVVWLGGAWLLHHITIRKLEHWDPFILPSAFLLVGWGMLSIWRLSFIFGIRQTLWYAFCIALADFFFNKAQIFESLKKYKYLLLTLGLSLAVLTFFFGTYPGGEGPKLWLGFRGIYFQPSEPLKLILILYLAAFFSEKYSLKFNILQTILPTLVLVAAALFILVGQRDLGTALIFIVIYIGMLYIAFGKRRILLIGALIMALAAISGYSLIDLIRIRFQAWALPWADPQSGSYQIIQSIMAIAAGGVFGTGIGIGYPHLVPIPHSDFIYASVIEESGLVGAVVMIGLFAVLLFRGIHAALTSGNRYYRFLAAGISVFLAFQTILIVGGNIRLLPITGVTLPLVSYGGSSLVTSLLSIFILVRISDNQPERMRDIQGLQPFRVGAILFSIGLFLLFLVTGWWAIFRSNDLQLRADNARNMIASRYVQRGSIQDRNGRALTLTEGSPGAYQNRIQYVPLSNTIGYYSSTFGIAGLQKVLGSYLSGQKGYPSFDTWFNYLLYDQPLPGRNAKLSLDLEIQETVDAVLADRRGAALVLNPESGEILAVSTSPYYDANALSENWESWKNNPQAPLLNRAFQGAYPLEELLTPFLLAEENSLLEQDLSSVRFAGLEECALGGDHSNLWSSATRDGCTYALQQAISDKSASYVINVIQRYGLNTSFELGLPTNPSREFEGTIHWRELLFGKNAVRVSPLQVAYAAGIFSSAGKQPQPYILSGVDTKLEGWVFLGSSASAQVISTENTETINRLLASEEITGWEISSLSQDANGFYSWYIAGTPTQWDGTPLVLVIVFEDENTKTLQDSGRKVFQQIIR